MSLDLDLTRRWLARWEGKRAVAYDDANGHTIKPGYQLIGNPTIGIGENLLTNAAKVKIAELSLDYHAVVAGAISLTDDQIDHLLTGSMASAVHTAQTIVPTFPYLADPQQLVLTDLSFNMGDHRLRQFVHMLDYVRMSKWSMAASELRNSKWFHQVGTGDHQRGGADANVLGGTADPHRILEG